MPDLLHLSHDELIGDKGGLTLTEEKFCIVEGHRYTIGDTIAPHLFPLVDDIYKIEQPAPTRWYVVQTNPNCEAKAEGGLVKAQAEIYMPRLRQWQRIPPRQRTKRGPTRQPHVRPLFPGYVFLGWSWAGEPPWLDIRRVDGVRAIIRPQSNRAMTLEILRFRSAEMAGEFDGCAKKQRNHRIGRFAPQFIRMTEAERVAWLVRHAHGQEVSGKAA